jgi:hypothetical protein
MKTFARSLVVIGAVLVLLAYFSTAGIPSAARDDFAKLLKDSGGSLSHTPTFPDTFMQMGHQRRMIQNFYLGASGLVFLFVGLQALCRQKRSSQDDTEA